MEYANKQIEKVVIGCILLKGVLYENIIGKITLNDFTHITCQKIFKIFDILYNNKIKIDIVTVSDYAYKNNILDAGLGNLTEIQNSVPTPEAINQYLKLLKNYTYNRTILKATENFRLGKITAEKLEGIISNTKLPYEIKKETNEDIILKTLQEAEKGTDFKFPENFEGINKITGGFDRGDLIIIGGYPSNGKSSMCVDLTKGFCNEMGYSVLFITLEMSVQANMRRILANTQKINTMKFRYGTLFDNDKEKIRNMIPTINNIWKYDCIRAYTMPDVVRSMSENQPDIVIIDYLQNIADHENLSEYDRLTKFTLQIQQIARKKSIAAILLSQFHRPQEGKIREPRNNDFRGSGSIEERAEMIFLLYWERKLKMESLSRKDGDDPEYMIVDITKNKDGETGRVEMKFYPEYHRWINWDDKTDEKKVIMYRKATDISKEAFKNKYKEGYNG
jgi:replicative DNA helicase